MTNNKLAIAIPTYNRSLILKENLLIMLPELKKYDIVVYISDDSNDDLTKEMISDLKIKYNNIKYFKNEPGLGHDKNCLKTLSRPKEEFIWYLGDSMVIENNGIKEVLDIIEKEMFDFIVVNSKNRNVKINCQVYYDANKLFVDLAWHATLTGATIYRKNILFRRNYSKYIRSNFMQLGIILEELVESKNGLYWLNKNLINSNKNKGRSYWNSATIKVFAEDWFDFIQNLPDDYICNNKIKVIKSHSDHTGIFKLKNYLMLRKENILNLKSYFKYYNKLKYATSLNIWVVFLITLIPRFILGRLYFISKKIKTLSN